MGNTAYQRRTDYGADEAEARLRFLIEVGFSSEDADRVFETVNLPSIEAMRGKIADLRTLGFADPVKMITSLPAILGLAIDNIRGKIADLRTLGFADPVKMITSSPAILGCSADRVRRAAGIALRFTIIKPYMLGTLCRKRLSILIALEAAQPGSWKEASVIIRAEYALLKGSNVVSAPAAFVSPLRGEGAAGASPST